MLGLFVFPSSTELWLGLQDLYCAYVIILVRAYNFYTHGGWAHRQPGGTFIDPEKTHWVFLVLLAGLELGSCMKYELESTLYPRSHPATPNIFILIFLTCLLVGWLAGWLAWLVHGDWVVLGWVGFVGASSCLGLSFWITNDQDMVTSFRVLIFTLHFMCWLYTSFHVLIRTLHFMCWVLHFISCVDSYTSFHVLILALHFMCWFLHFISCVDSYVRTFHFVCWFLHFI